MAADTAARNAEMIAARASGETLKSIADRYGLTKVRVRQITIRGGVRYADIIVKNRRRKLAELTFNVL